MKARDTVMSAFTLRARPLVAFALLAGGALHAPAILAAETKHCQQLLAESKRLELETLGSVQGIGQGIRTNPRAQQIQQRMQEVQREMGKDGESIEKNMGDPKVMEAFHKRHAVRMAELDKLSKEYEAIQKADAPAQENATQRTETIARRRDQAAETYEKECHPEKYARDQRERQERKKQQAEQDVVCEKRRKVSSDHYQKTDRLNEEIKGKRKPYETAQAQLDAYKKGDYKIAFDVVDAAYSSGRQPTPAQLTALSKAEQQLKFLQQDADTKKRRSEQETAPLLAQIEKDHQSHTDYNAKTPQACRHERD